MRRTGLTVLRVAVSLGLIALLLRQVAPDQVAAMLRASLDNWPLLLLAATIPALGQLIAGLRWQLLLGGLGIQVGLGRLVAATTVGTFFNTFLPSTIGGDAMRAWWVRDAAGSATRSFTVVALDRLIGLIAFCVVGLIAAALVPSIVRDVPAIWIVAIATVLGVAVLTLAMHPAVHRLAGSLFELPLLRRIRDKAATAGEALVGLRRTRARLAGSFGLGVLLQLNVIAQFLVLAAALNVGISLWTLAVLVPIVNLITLLPVSINGFGVREATLAVLGAPFGLSVGEAVLLAYAWVLSILLYGLIGGLIYLRGRGARPSAPIPGPEPAAAAVQYDPKNSPAE